MEDRSMDLNKIKNNKELKDIIKIVKNNCKGKEFSDIIDDNGFQYIDLVMEGGGMLGIALVGYTYVLEQMGIRFLGLGGTSAGSINALLLAALGKPEEAKGEKLLLELANKDFYDFVDGDSDARDLIDCWIKGVGNIKLGFKAIQVLDNLQNNLGLNPGDSFVNWLRDILKRENIVSTKQLRERMESLPSGLRTRQGKVLDTPEKAGTRLALISADVSTETKVEFPKMACLYWKNPDNVDPALFVRASMSIPYFFEPLKINSLPQGAAAAKRWKALAGFISKNEGGVPKDALFIDGGIMSNFPIDVFHDTSKIPDAPTFGVKLELDHRRKSINGPLNLFGAIFNSARHTLDYDFIHRNPDYMQLVTWIPAEGYNWLDFNMSDEHKMGLFLEGAKSAADFLCGFNWQHYKELRQIIAAEV
jgi:NTE family protein